MRKKRKEPAADKQAGSKGEAKARAKAKHILKDRIKELDSQEARLLLRFLESYPPADVSLAALELLWGFLKWLRSEKIYIVNAEDVFCVPFSHLVAAKNLK